MAVVASATGAAVFGLSGVAAGLAGGALLGAGAGALYSGITGDGNILNSALTGGLIGGAVGGIGAALAPAAAGTTAAGTTAAGTSAVGATPALTAAKTGVGGLSGASGAAGSMGAASPLQLSGAVAPQGFAAPVYAKVGANTAAGMSGGQMLGAGLAGTAALSLLGGMNQPKLPNSPVDPGQIRPYTYSSVQNDGQNGTTSAYPTTPTYGANGLPIIDTRERNYFTQSYTAGTPYQAANGGLMAEGGITYDPKTQTYQGLPRSNPLPAVEVPQLTSDIVSQLTPQWQAANPNAFAYDPVKQRYSAATPNMAQLNAFKSEQDRIAAEAAAAAAANQMSQGYDSFSGGANGGLMQAYAMGGNVGQYNLGGYSDGGRLLKGPGDGVSDDIPAVIGNKQPARLADGEFVIPARIVSELGNGSTDAGAKRLYAMMDKIQAGRKKTIGKNNVAKDTKAKKHLLA